MKIRKTAASLALAAWTALALAACAESATSPRTGAGHRSVLTDTLIDPPPDPGGGGTANSTTCGKLVRRKFSGHTTSGTTLAAGQTYVFSGDGCDTFSWTSTNALVSVTPVNGFSAEVQAKRYDPLRDTATISYYNSGYVYSWKVKVVPATLTLTGNDRVTVNNVLTLALNALDDAGEGFPASTWPEMPVVATSNSGVATVTQSAGNVYVSGRAVGSAAITASLLGGSTSKVVSVVSAGAITVTVSPSGFRTTVGSSKGFTATATDAAGNPVSGTVTWSSSNPTVATVDATGRATARSGGQANITATINGASGYGVLNVQQCSDCQTGWIP